MDVPVSVRSVGPQAHAQLRAWDCYVKAHPQAGFFHLSGWGAVVERVWGHRAHRLAAWRGERLVGVLPLGEVKHLLFGHALVSQPFAVYGGVVADDEAAARALEQEALRLASTLGAAHLELRNIEARHADWPQQDLYVTFRKALHADDEANMLAIPRKQRAMVRKGIGNGLRADIDPDAGRFFSLFADNVHRHGTPAMPRAWFEALLAQFGSDAEVLTVVSPKGKPLSSVLSFYFRDEVLPYYAGDDLQARELAANDFKYWALMQHAVRRGARLFDYGRSKVGTGPWSFKKNWGFTPQPLSYEFQLLHGQDLPQHNPNNPKYRLLIQAWQRMPLALANRLGPPIVRGLA
jgi:FemAB-related protein (PEP-CTERM system-associated)